MPWLWELHKLHHSIEELDWIGNFRFHWAEVLVYKTLSYLPLVVLGVDGRVLLAVAVLWTVMLDLNHANVPISWGPAALRAQLAEDARLASRRRSSTAGRPELRPGAQRLGLDFGTAYWPDDREAPRSVSDSRGWRPTRAPFRAGCYPLWPARGVAESRKAVYKVASGGRFRRGWRM